jgi:hypothetical protein
VALGGAQLAVDTLAEVGAVDALAGLDDVGDALQPVDVVVDAVEHQGVQRLAQHEQRAGEVGLALGGELGRHRLAGFEPGADDDHRRGAEAPRRRQRNVLAQAAVAVVLPVELHRREEEGDGGGGEGVRRGELGGARLDGDVASPAGRVPSARSTKMVVLPVAMWVVETVTASISPARRLSRMRRKSMPAATTRPRPAGSRMPPRRGLLGRPNRPRTRPKMCAESMRTTWSTRRRRQ